MSLLDDIRSEIGAVFSDAGLFFSAAEIIRAPQEAGWAEPVGYTPSRFPCMAMVDVFSDHLRAVQNIPHTHVKLMILGAGLAVQPLKGDSVVLAGQSWRIMGPVHKDPAGAVWTAQAAPV